MDFRAGFGRLSRQGTECLIGSVVPSEKCATDTYCIFPSLVPSAIYASVERGVKQRMIDVRARRQIKTQHARALPDCVSHAILLQLTEQLLCHFHIDDTEWMAIIAPSQIKHT